MASLRIGKVLDIEIQLAEIWVVGVMALIEEFDSPLRPDELKHSLEVLKLGVYIDRDNIDVVLDGPG